MSRTGGRNQNGEEPGLQNQNRNPGPARQKKQVPLYEVTDTHSTSTETARAARSSTRQRKIVTLVSFLLVTMIVVSAGLLLLRSVNWNALFTVIYTYPFNNDNQENYAPPLSEEERESYLTKYITVRAEDVYTGSCILVNKDHPYHFPEDEDVISVYKNKTSSYLCSSGNEMLKREAIEAMNGLMDAFYARTQKRTVTINSAWRSKAGQQRIIDMYLESDGQEYVDQYVQAVGASEHHTGYAFDLVVYEVYEDETSAMWAFDGKGVYYWIDQNCEQYGIVLRYSASKEEITGISYESWHYRYLGVGNALAITQMAAALEEYVERMHDYSYDGGRYPVRADNGDLWEVYYVAASGGETTEIPIPTNADYYETSGNNIDGYIVSVCYRKK